MKNGQVDGFFRRNNTDAWKLSSSSSLTTHSSWVAGWVGVDGGCCGKSPAKKGEKKKFGFIHTGNLLLDMPLITLQNLHMISSKPVLIYCQSSTGNLLLSGAFFPFCKVLHSFHHLFFPYCCFPWGWRCFRVHHKARFLPSKWTLLLSPWWVEKKREKTVHLL